MTWWIVLGVAVVVILVLRSFRPKELPKHGAAPSRTLKVVKLVRETPDAVAVHLEDAHGAPIEFLPGQFFSFKFVIDGETLWRNYSLCSMPGEAPLAVAVKRTATGKVSNYINSQLKEGDLIEVRGPSGRFVCEPETAADRHHVLIAGGSGVTPMMSILRSVLENEPLSRVSLIYGNRGEPDIIFRARLAELEAGSKGRLKVVHALSDPPAGWTGLTGVLDAPTLAKALDLAGADAGATVRYYLCGPQPMMEGAHKVLKERGVPEAQILEERFSIPVHTVSVAGAQPVTFVVGGERTTVEVKPSQTILEAGLAQGLNLDHSCTIGVCGTCMVKKRSGKVQMNEGHCLSDAELEQGFVLICCAHPLEPTEVEVDQ